jgi:hypothetical protein
VKTFIQYARVFLYTAKHWSLRLAIFKLYHDIRGGLRYRIKTFPPVKLEGLTLASAQPFKSSPYEAVNYFMLEKLLSVFREFSGHTSIVDLGCGKGRALVVSAYFGFRDITGIDLAKELCDEAYMNMKKTQAKIPALVWRVIHANILDYEIRPADSVFFLFNPFDEETLISFLEKLERSCRLFPRKTFFIYASPVHASRLVDRGFNYLFRHEVLGIRGCILAREKD